MEENLNNNKEPKTKGKNKKAKIAVITLSTILVLILGLQVYAGAKGYGNVFFMIRDLTTTKDATGENEVFIEEKIEEKTEKKELDINSEEVKKLYNYILKENSEIETYAYQSKKITVNELDNDTKLCTVLSNLEDKDADDKKTIQGVAGKLNQFFYNQSTIDKKVNEIFGTKVNLKYKSIDDIATMTDYTYENNQYVKSEIQQGGGDYPAHTVEYIVKAEKDNDELMIYDKFCYLCDNQDAAYDIYNGSDKNEVFAKRISGEKIYFQVHDRDEKLNKKVIDNIEKIVGKQVLTYKHTFKKNSDGNYYWYSTEPLKDTINTTDKTNTTNTSTNETMNNNEQLEPDNYADEVAKDEIEKKVLEYIEKNQKNGTAERLVDYKVEKIELLSEKDKMNLVNQNPGEYKASDYLGFVYYSVKPQNINNTRWLAGSGIVEGEWIKNKMTCVTFRDGNILGMGATSF